MDAWLGRASAAPIKPAAKKAAASAASALPTTCENYALPAPLTRMLAAQAPTISKRMAWPLAGRLGFGCSPMDRPDCTEWLLQHAVRVVIDVSYGDVPDQRRFASAVRAANAVLIHMPMDSKHKMQRATTELYVSVCRTLGAVLSSARSADGVEGEPPFAVFVCDSRGGGVAALVVELLVATALHCTLADACVFVTRSWNNNLAESVAPQRMFPEGDVLKEAVTGMFARLREQPITAATSGGTAAAATSMEDTFVTHRVRSIGRAALKLLDLSASVLLVPPPFQRTQPMGVVTWVRKNEPVMQRSSSSSSYPTTSKRQWNRDDDDSEDDDNDDWDDDTPNWKNSRQRRGRAYDRHQDDNVL